MQRNIDDDALNGSVVIEEYSTETNQYCVPKSDNREPSRRPEEVAQKLSEWTESEVEVRSDGSVAVDIEEMPLPGVRCGVWLKESGWSFDGYEDGSVGVYREVSRR